MYTNSGGRVALVLLVASLATAAQWRPMAAQAPPDRQEPQTTVKRLRQKGWWPTRTDAARSEFAGTDACASCHKNKVLAQLQTSMAHAAWKASEAEVLRLTPVISHSAPPFKTTISRGRHGSTYDVSRGGQAMSGQIVWTMGDGTMGQTFVLRSGDSLFESQLSYFTAIKGLDFTPGHTKAPPQDLERAFGERQNTETAQKCFACHTTMSSVRGQFDPERATPGVTCEACHGPGAQHVKAMNNGQTEKGREEILDPGSFDPVKLVDFCGACHRTPMDVAAAKDYVPINIRFQPYRLSKSRCWSRADDRISCVACHDPHNQLVRDGNFYDQKCLACHSPSVVPATSAGQGPSATGKLPTCRVSSSHCVSCHMPKYNVVQMHGSFTDHDIRVVRPGDAYPL